MGSRAVGWVVRRLEPADDLDVLLAGTPTWPGAERVAASFAAAAGTPSIQLVAVERGGLVGYAHCLTTPVAEGRRAAGHVWVDHAARGRGIGTALWKHVLDAAEVAGLAGVRVAVDLADTRSLAVAGIAGLGRSCSPRKPARPHHAPGRGGRGGCGPGGSRRGPLRRLRWQRRAGVAGPLRVVRPAPPRHP